MRHGLLLRIDAWQETDEHGTVWWCAQEVMAHGASRPIGPIFRSRVSRMRAESYVLDARARELADMHKGS